MGTITRIVFLLALIVWLGEVLFLSLVAAPIVFRTFAVEEAGRVVSALFPVYYKIGSVCGVLLLAAAVVLRSSGEARGAWTVVAGVAAAMLAATLYAAVIVQPRAQLLRAQLHQTGTPPAVADAVPSVREEFDALHRLAVQLNSVVLFGGLAIAVIAALKLKP